MSQSKLLPRSHAEFRSKAFWETFFQERQKSGGTFEWYGEWKDIVGVVGPLIQSTSSILVVGCGNSSLSADLYDWGARNITSVDFSALVIEEMAAKNTLRPEMRWLTADVTSLPLESASFDFVIDKGLLDAMAADDTPTAVADVRRMFSESARVLKPRGAYLCVSLGQAHVLRELCAFPVGAGPPAETGWNVRVYLLEDMKSPGVALCPLLAVCNRFIKPSDTPGNKLLLAGGGQMSAVSPDDVAIAVREAQWRFSLRKKSSTVERGNSFSLDVWSEDAAAAAGASGAGGGVGPRYSITAVDVSRKQSCGVFLVPQGREHEWSFHDPEGMEKMAESTGFGRLYFVYLNRGHTFPSQERVKTELSPVITDLAPAGNTGQIPFLAVADDLGSRTPVLQATSALSGDFVIEDVTLSGGETLRRMVFKSNMASVQSEARLLSAKKAVKAGKRKDAAPSSSAPAPVAIDHDYLSFEYHVCIVSGLSLLVPLMRACRGDKSKGNVKVLVVGQGGGLLPMFLHTHFDVLDVTTVELDPDISRTASQCFGFAQVSREGAGSNAVIIDDGLEVIRRIAESAVGESSVPVVTERTEALSLSPSVSGGPSLPPQHMIVIDVDCKDSSSGMPFPPKEFVTPAFLATTRSALAPGGVLVLNVASRAKGLFNSVLEDIKSVFPCVLDVPPVDGINHVLFCMAEGDTVPKSLQDVHSSARLLMTLASRPWAADLDVPHGLSGLTALQGLSESGEKVVEGAAAGKKKKGKRR